MGKTKEGMVERRAEQEGSVQTEGGEGVVLVAERKGASSVSIVHKNIHTTQKVIQNRVDVEKQRKVRKKERTTDGWVNWIGNKERYLMRPHAWVFIPLLLSSPLFFLALFPLHISFFPFPAWWGGGKGSVSKYQVYLLATPFLYNITNYCSSSMI